MQHPTRLPLNEGQVEHCFFQKVPHIGVLLWQLERFERRQNYGQ
jgi:hypothetical protein